MLQSTNITNSIYGQAETRHWEYGTRHLHRASRTCRMLIGKCRIYTEPGGGAAEPSHGNKDRVNKGRDGTKGFRRCPGGELSHNIGIRYRTLAGRQGPCDFSIGDPSGDGH